jgi:undecaprenyl-diphosphatase
MTETLSWLHILVLAIVQGVAELLPVSSSAHVIVAERLMGLDPTAPDMTMLLVMLHTGTMFAVIIYFWAAWRRQFFASKPQFVQAAKVIVAATAVTGVIGFGLLLLIEKVLMRGTGKTEIEQLFGNHYLIASGLAAAGILIVVSGFRSMKERGGDEVRMKSALWIGAVQGLCLPVRGFSRSGATVSTGLLAGVARDRAEAFSFALAVVLTPAVIVKEGWRFYKAIVAAGHGFHDLVPLLAPSIVGMFLSFAAGLVALRWLSRWLESGRWQYFGFYCLVVSAVLFVFGNRLLGA